MRHIPSGLCQLGWISCFGCCGHNFKDKETIAKAITKNTLEFHHHRRNNKSLVEFMNRHKDLRLAGICRNLVYDHKNGSIFCPLHPEQNKGKDHRIDHHYCDILHVCKTAFFYDLWDDKMKKDFIGFLRGKKKEGRLDWHSYSVGMANDSLLEEFEGLKWD
ncbi:TPA: hypothetical protein HA265_04180 [Candidatus Woesearchaeota archaeon]|nr:hypothetical protein [Candidatus Woesearchaeota archaeon]